MPADKTPKAPAKKTAAPARTGAAKSTTGETVSAKAAPSPKTRADGNTPATRPAKPSQKVEAHPKTAKTTPTPKDDHTEATGRDHPSQSEHMHRLLEKLHGTSDQKANPPGGPPKRGFDPKSFGGKGGQVRGGNNLRRTQGKGG